MTATEQNRLMMHAVILRTAVSAIMEAAPFIELMPKVSGSLDLIREVAEALDELAVSQLQPSSSVSATHVADSGNTSPSGAPVRSRRRRKP